MPWHVAKSDSCPDSKPWAVIKDSDSSVVACHETEESANDQMAALYASERGQQMGEDRQTIRDLWRKFKSMVNIALDAQEKIEIDRALSMPRLYEAVSTALWERETYAYLLDVYADDGGLYALMAEEGKLYRASLETGSDEVTMGEWQQVTEIHEPVTQRMTVQRQADGQWRWLNISGAAVLNRVGEIDSKALFDNMARRAAESGEYPYRTFYHMGEAFQIGQADFLARDGALYITSGLFDDNPLARAVVRAVQDEPEYWGDSIGYLPVGEPDMVEVAEGVEVPVYSDGIHREISTLPEQNAASLFTVPSVQQQEVQRMNAKVLEALERLRDEHGLEQEAIDALVDVADQTNRSIEDEDLITREGDQEIETDEPAQELDEEAEDEESDEDPEPDAEPQEREQDEPDAPEGDLEVELDEEAVEAIVDRVAEAKFFTEQGVRLDGIQATITELVERVDAAEQRAEGAERRLAELERDEEDRQREWLEDQPRRRTIRVSHRPREANRRGNGDGAAEASLADEAEATLNNMPRY